jgi:RNA polymerase sigma factor (sigma-70 family)
VSAVTGSEKASALQRGGRVPLALPRQLLRLRSDAALAERYLAGDESAFDVIYERHRPVVLAVCMGVLGTAHDAEDAAQETFSSLASELRSAAPAELRPWLIRVARNASIDLTRRRKHRLLTFDGEIPEIPARPQSGSAELENVISGIRELPENQRTALLMREMGGHSYNEIAETLETDEESVRGLISRARSGMRSYREATELPCAVARLEIETEPDARRYDKTVRRHLKVCKPCSHYRTQMRDDASAVRTAMPAEANAVIGGGIAGRGLSAGAFTAAKTGVAISQLAATCAASVCAVGAVGGLVILHPDTHMFGLTGVHLRSNRHVAPKVPKAHHVTRSASTHTTGGYHPQTPVQGLTQLSVPVVSRHHQQLDRIAYGAAATNGLRVVSGSDHARSAQGGSERHHHGSRIQGGAGAYGWGNYSHKHLDRRHWDHHSVGSRHSGSSSGSHSGSGSSLTTGGSSYSGPANGSTNPYGYGSGSGHPSTSGGYGGSGYDSPSSYGGPNHYDSPSTYGGASNHSSSSSYSGPGAYGGSTPYGDPSATAGTSTYSGPTMSGGSTTSAGSSSYGGAAADTGSTAPAGSGTATGSTTSAGSTNTGSTSTGSTNTGSTSTAGSTPAAGSASAGSSSDTGSTSTGGSSVAGSTASEGSSATASTPPATSSEPAGSTPATGSSQTAGSTTAAGSASTAKSSATGGSLAAGSQAASGS